MKFSRKLFLLAVFIAFGFVLLVPGGPTQPRIANAAFDCTATGTLEVEIIDESIGTLITVAGAQVQFSPNAESADTGGTDNVIDNGGEDDDSTVGRITQEDACSTSDASVHSVELLSLPAELDDCAVVDDSATGTLDPGGITTLELLVDCDGNGTPGSPTIIPVAIAVTASPNVIPCGGTALITASGRDVFGQVIEGLGFHFSTDSGTLIMGPPNTAHQTIDSAILSLAPGQKSATVKAWVGGQSRNPGVVTVQQFCLGVTTDSSTAPGLISLTSSTPQMNCGESAFIGVRVRDSKNQVPPDGTVVNLLANSGTLAPTSAVTVNGVLNVLFISAGSTSSGTVRITAASGDAFGSLSLQINCQAAAPAGAAGGAGRAPCVPIGDGICIQPPNTGDGGLKD